MTSKLVVNTIEADTGISSVSFGSSISLSSTSKFFFSNAGIDIGADTNINRPASGVLGFNINSSEKVRIDSNNKVGIATDTGNGLINTRHAGTNQQVLHVRADLGSSNGRSLNLYTPDTDNTEAPFRFQTGNGYLFQCDSENVFTIAHDRRIGIGTNNPTAKLEVKGSNNPLVKIVQDTSGIARLNIESATNDGYQYSGIGLGDGTNDAELMWTTGGFDINVGNAVRFRIESDGDFRLSGDNAATNYGWIRGWQSSTGDMIIGADQSATGTGTSRSNLIFRTRGSERARIQTGGLKLNGGSYIVECSEGGGGTTNNNTKIMDQRRWMWYGASSSTHTVARVAKAASGQPGDGDSSLAAWIVTYTARSMYGFNSDGGYSVMKMRTGRFDYNDNEVRFSTEQDTLGTGGGSQNPTIVFTDEGSGVVRISITNPSSTHSFGEINLMTYDCRITLPSG